MYIVTGAAGFIGSYLVEELNRRFGEQVILVDRLDDDERWKNLQKLKYIDFIDADEFLMSLEEIPADLIQGVFHMGACSSTTETDMGYLMENNTNYSKALFAYCAEFNIPFIYASSAATYGAGELGYSDNEDLVPKLKPLNRYGYSKQLMDEWALKQPVSPDRWAGVKFFNVYGPNECHKAGMRSVVIQAFEQINNSDKMKLFKSHKEGYADGEQLRDFVYVKDVVNAMIELMHKEKCENGIYNLGTGVARSFKDLVVATFKAMNKEPNIEFIDMPEHLQAQYQYFTQADMEKSFRNLDMKFHSLEEGVTDYVQSFLMSC